LKARTEGPAAYVFSADETRTGAQAELLRVLQKQGVEISRATAPFTVTLPAKKSNARPTTTNTNGQDGDGSASLSSERLSGPQEGQDRDNQKRSAQPTIRTFPAGSYIVRMDQPYSRIA